MKDAGLFRIQETWIYYSIELAYFSIHQVIPRRKILCPYNQFSLGALHLAGIAIMVFIINEGIANLINIIALTVLRMQQQLVFIQIEFASLPHTSPYRKDVFSERHVGVEAYRIS